MHKVWDPFLEQADRAVVEMWEKGRWAEFCAMLPMYADKCWGEGDMHDTAMLLGMLGWDRYEAPVEIVTPYFGSSGTGQINAVFPVTALCAGGRDALARRAARAGPRPARLPHRGRVVDDGERHVSGASPCLLMRRYGSVEPETMVVWLHGDVSAGGPASYHFARRRGGGGALRRPPRAVDRARPAGLSGRQRRVVVGRRARRRGRADHYTLANLAEVGAAIERLRARFKPKAVVVVGHSGGAATAAVLLGMRPGLIDAAILVSCPCEPSSPGAPAGARVGAQRRTRSHWAERVPRIDQGRRRHAATPRSDNTPAGARSRLRRRGAGPRRRREPGRRRRPDPQRRVPGGRGRERARAAPAGPIAPRRQRAHVRAKLDSAASAAAAAPRPSAQLRAGAAGDAEAERDERGARRSAR